MQAHRSPFAGLRSLLDPDRNRWKPMLAGLALFASGAGAAVLLRPSEFVAMGLVSLALVAWVVGAFAMIGYVRWFFAAEFRQAERERDTMKDKEDGSR